MTSQRHDATPTVPYDLDDEAVLLGAALATQPAAQLVAAQTSAADFYDPFHRRVRDAIANLVAVGQPVEIATVASDLARRNGVNGDLSDAKKQLWTLRSACAAPSNAAAYLAHVKEWTTRRSALTIASELTRIAHTGGSPDEPLSTMLGSATTQLTRLTDADPGTSITGRLVTGGAFIAAAEEDAAPIHGHGEDVLHAAGEPTFVVARTGVGKSTYGQNYILHRIGLRTDDWLGLPVTPLPLSRSILYIAADRPRQVRRSLRRMVSDDQLDYLDDALYVWRGPLPFLLNHDPFRLATFVRALEQATGRIFDEVILDSLKDVANELAKDEGGSAVAIALSRLVADDRNCMVLHHERKAERVAKKAPGSIDDIYGSQFLGACAGNVVYLFGEPGAHILTLHHLKQSSDEVGPLTLRHDHTTGRLELHDQTDLVGVLRAARGPLTVKEACAVLLGDSDPSANTIEKVRRRLEKLVEAGVAVRRDALAGHPVTYVASETRYGECP